MSFKSLHAVTQRLTTSMEALAAIVAELKLRHDGQAGDPHVRKRLLEVIDSIEPGLLDDLTREQEGLIYSNANAFLRQAMDLVENVNAHPGWRFKDPAILQAYGVMSRSIVRSLDENAPQCPEFDQALRSPGTFVDLGTGVAGLAMEAARTWPALTILGIDIWEPALALARENLEIANLLDRVELRKQRLEDIRDVESFSVIWVAGTFFSADSMSAVLKNLYYSLKPGGWIVFGLTAMPPDPLEHALANLKIVRRGGHPWSIPDVEAALREARFTELQTFTPPNHMWFTLGRRAKSIQG